jgi:hypothetical protein
MPVQHPGGIARMLRCLPKLLLTPLLFGCAASNTFVADSRFSQWDRPAVSAGNPCAGIMASVTRQTSSGGSRSSFGSGPLIEVWRTAFEADGSAKVLGHWFGDGPVNARPHDGSLPAAPLAKVVAGQTWTHEFDLTANLSGAPHANANPPGRWHRTCTAISRDDAGQVSVRCETTINNSQRRDESFVWRDVAGCPVPVRYEATWGGTGMLATRQSWTVGILSQR